MRALKLFAMFAAFSLPVYANFTPGKNIYEVALEYEVTEDENSNKYHVFELSNEIGLTDNASIGLNVFYEKMESETYFKYFEAFHKLNFAVSPSVNFAVRNMLRTYSDEGEKEQLMYELRGMVKHDAQSGIYKRFRVDLAFRKKFKDYEHNVVRIDTHLNLRLSDSVTYVTRVDTYLAVVDKGTLQANPSFAKTYGSTGLKLSEMVLYTGPSFDSQYGSFYMFLRADIDGKSSTKKKGVLIGYSKAIEL